MRGSLCVLLVVIPLLPIHGFFAIPLVVIACVNLLMLSSLRAGAVPRGGAELAEAAPPAAHVA